MKAFVWLMIAVIFCEGVLLVDLFFITPLAYWLAGTMGWIG